MDDILDEYEMDTQELNDGFDDSAISREEDDDVTASTVDFDEEHKQIDPKIDQRIETVSPHASTSTCKTQPLRKLTQRTDEVVKEGLSKNQKRKRRKKLKNEQTEDETNGNGRRKVNVECPMNRDILQVDKTDNIKEKINDRCVTEANRENNGIRNCQISNGVEDQIEHVVTGVTKKLILSICYPLDWISLQTLQLLKPGVSKRPNYHIIDKIPSSVLVEFSNLSKSLNTLLTNLPLDTASIASTIDDYLLFLPFLHVRPLRWLYESANFITGLAKTHEDFAAEPTERNARRYFNNLHRDLKRELQMRRLRVMSVSEAGVVDDLVNLRLNLQRTVSVEMHGYMARKRSEFDRFAWRYWRLKRWECGSLTERTFCMISDKLRTDDELLETDECRERRFVYDGSYYEGNCTRWLHFRNLFLNSVVSVAFGGQSSIRPLVQHLAIADAESPPDDASNILPQSSRHSEDSNSNPDDNASVYDETFNTFEDRLTTKSVYKRDLESSRTEDLVQNDEKSDSSFCGAIQIGDLNVSERETVFENEEIKIEDIGNTTADTSLCAQEFSKTKSVMLSIVFLLVFRKFILFTLPYCFDIVFLLLVFMSLCVYFVIKS